MSSARADAVIDASAVVEMLLGSRAGAEARQQMRGRVLHAPAHMDAEVLSALGRLQRAGQIEVAEVSEMLRIVTATPIRRHPLAPLLPGAWERRADLRLVDALYVELAASRGVTVLSTDARLARGSDLVELVGPDGLTERP